MGFQKFYGFFPKFQYCNNIVSKLEIDFFFLFLHKDGQIEDMLDQNLTWELELSSRKKKWRLKEAALRKLFKNLIHASFKIS